MMMDGTITLADGTKMLLKEYINLQEGVEKRSEIEESENEEVRERKRSIGRKRVVGEVWDGVRSRDGEVVTYDRYRLATENLKRKESIMGGKGLKKGSFDTKAFGLFECLFKNPGMWLSARRLGEMVGVQRNSVTTLLKRPIPFLIREELLQERVSDDGRSREWMFKGRCDNPKEEARLWYGKMFEGTEPLGRKKVSTVPAVKTPDPVPAVIKGGNGLLTIQIDIATSEVVLRLPLARLPLVVNTLAEVMK